MHVDAHPQPVPSDYREFPVPSRLASHFLCLWTQTVSSQSAYDHRVLPDGCVDIVFLNDDLPLVVGPWTDPFIARLTPGTQILGMRLHPGLACSALGVPAAELLNQSAPLSAIWNSTRNTRIGRVFDEQTLSARRSALAEALEECLHFAPLDRTVLASIQWMSRNPHGRIDQLSQWTGISSRQLHRRFCAAVGYGPKTLQSVLRFQRLLNLARENGARHSLAYLAIDAGYSDQPHMTREIRRFANCPPTELLPSNGCTLEMSDLFKTRSPS